MNLRAFVIAVATCVAVPAAAQEVNGCTLWSSHYADDSWDCMNLRVARDCTYDVCFGFICVPTPGKVFEGWFPTYGLEATNRSGESVFANGLGVALGLELDKAKKEWQLRTGGLGVFGLGGTLVPGTPEEQYRAPAEMPKATHQTQMMFGRAVRLPYAQLGWGYPELEQLAGDPIPTCFLGLSEFAPETWADTVDSGDRELAAAWAPLTGPACAVAAPVAGTIARILGSALGGASQASSGMLPCAVPLPAAVQFATAIASSSAYDPRQACMNSLGPRLPRTGYSDGDNLASAQRVAWRIASMSEDMFKTGVGVEAKDKWQVVLPKVPKPACFKPGEAHLPMLFPGEVAYRVPGYDAAGSVKSSEFVFVVWRHHEKCVDLARAAVLEVDINLLPTVRKIACMVVNSMTGTP